MLSLQEIQERLKKYDTDKLLDVVKNHKQYGYSAEVRDYALLLLKEKGVSQEDVELTGNMENSNYELASRLYASFENNSKIAFISYSCFFASRITSRIIFHNEAPPVLLLIVSVLLLVTYLVFLAKSFLDQAAFYKTTGEQGESGPLIYFLIGMPFYIIMYFVFRSQMREKMKLIV